MGKRDFYRQRSINEALDAYQEADNDDEHLNDFYILILDELLYNVRKVPYDNIISTKLIHEGAAHYGFVRNNSLDWLYTANRLNISGKTVYSFRFANPCHPDHYESFITQYHPYFILSKEPRHGLNEWYKYIGKDLPKRIINALKIAKVRNEQQPYGPKIFVNNKYERLDIKLKLQSGGYSELIVITFEPGYPATVV